MLAVRKKEGTSIHQPMEERKIRLVSIKLVPEIETFLSDSYKRFRLSLRFQSLGSMAWGSTHN